MTPAHPDKPRSLLREFMEGEAAGGIVLMAAAAAALIVANSPLAHWYFEALEAHLGPLSVEHWINDALMAVFFLLVGLEIKREFVDGQLSTWPRRILPGVSAAGGMMVPALIYVAFNRAHPETLGGWAIPTATDIAFALGVLALLGSRVPVSLKVFLTALAIIDDLGAVVIIAVFYTSGISLAFLGALLWFRVLKAGVHATIAGVALAMTIPLRMKPGHSDDIEASPLHRLEHALHSLVPFIIVPVFGFANAGVRLVDIPASAFVDPLTLGVAIGLVAGKLVGVFGFAALTIRLRLADMPLHASWAQLLGVALLCGIGFTMSLFVSLLAFAGAPALQDEAKLGILGGSLIAGLLGFLVLRLQKRPPEPAADPAD